ncbi:MAG: hypothetical protein R3F62_09315 [Planctomycetota bacterium]
MKVVFLSGDPAEASARVRIHEHLDVLREQGLEPTVWTIPRSVPARLRAWRRLRDAEVVVLQRKLLDRVSLGALRRHAPRLVYDLDDALYTRPHGRPDGRQRRRFARTLSQVDLVLAGSEYLARAARERGGRRVAVWRPGVALPAATATPEAEPVRVVWTGSAATLPYLEQTAPLLRALQRRVPGWSLDVIADAIPSLPGVTLRAHRWSPRVEDEVLSGAQLGIYPLPDTPWARGKCAYKVLRYLAHGLAVLSVPQGGGAEVLGEPPAGRVAALDAWGDALGELLRDPAARRALGAAGREHARRAHALAARSAELAELLRRL